MYKLSCQSIHPLSQMDNIPSKAYLTHRHASATRISRCLRSPAKPISSLRPRQDAPIDVDFAGNVCSTPRLKALCPGGCVLDITGITESPSLKTTRTYHVLLRTFPFCRGTALLIYSAWELRANVRCARSAKGTKVAKLFFLQTPAPESHSALFTLCMLASMRHWTYLLKVKNCPWWGQNLRCCLGPFWLL